MTIVSGGKVHEEFVLSSYCKKKGPGILSVENSSAMYFSIVSACLGPEMVEEWLGIMIVNLRSGMCPREPVSEVMDKFEVRGDSMTTSLLQGLLVLQLVI